MLRLSQPLIWSILVLLSILHWFGVKEVSAQETLCDTGTVPADCTYLPMVASINVATEEVNPEPIYAAIPVDGPTTDRQPSLHGDLNLSLRGYTSTVAALELVDVNGGADVDAPQLSGLFSEPRLPTFAATFQVYDWDWACGENGCPTQPLDAPPVTALAMATSSGENIYLPSRAPQIYAGGYKALVLYAESERITLTYLREDTVAFGYALHIENIQVDPALLALYQTLNAAGRGELPGLRNGDKIGTALGTSITIAIRDRGTFMDPRSRKDWWQGY